jgi:hypothetical protein
MRQRERVEPAKMTLFRYTTTMDSREYEIEADYYEVLEQTSVNLRGETSIVVMYVFYKDEQDIYNVPALYMQKIREVS